MTTRLRQRWLLAVLVAGQFMANVDIAIVNVATPSIHRDLHASGGALEFVVSGYVLAFAMLIITGARLGRIAVERLVECIENPQAKVRRRTVLPVHLIPRGSGELPPRDAD